MKHLHLAQKDARIQSEDTAVAAIKFKVVLGTLEVTTALDQEIWRVQFQFWVKRVHLLWEDLQQIR